MSLTVAQRHAWSLACTLMVCVTLFHVDRRAKGTPLAG